MPSETPNRAATSVTLDPLSMRVANASNWSAGCIGRRTTFSARPISVPSASLSIMPYLTGRSGATWPRSARAVSASSLLCPATTVNLPRADLRTTRDCSSPCAAMDAASSSMPSDTPVLRTLPAQDVSLFNGMVVIKVSFQNGAERTLRRRLRPQEKQAGRADGATGNLGSRGMPPGSWPARQGKISIARSAPPAPLAVIKGGQGRDGR